MPLESERNQSQSGIRVRARASESEGPGPSTLARWLEEALRTYMEIGRASCRERV